jgi:hypothetical protein
MLPTKALTLIERNLEAFLDHGGMRSIEYSIGAQAAEEAIRNEREYWLHKLEGWLEIYQDDFAQGYLKDEINVCGVVWEFAGNKRRRNAGQACANAYVNTANGKLRANL